MSFDLSYCPNGAQTLDRLTQLYQNRSQQIVLAKMNTPSRALADFAAEHPAGFCSYPVPAERIEFWDSYNKEHANIHDDSIPTAYLSEMDQGLYGGLLGGDVRFLCDPATGWISSMVPPILKDWQQFDDLSFSTDHSWFRRYVNQLKIFVEKSSGRFGISHFILINGLNFIFELVGATQTYLDLDERPEMINKALDLAYEVNLSVQKTFFELTPLLCGGTCSNFAQWLPGKIISESIDPFHMTSVDYFEKWGRKPVEKIFSQFDGGVIHIHGNGRHLLKAASTIKGLKAIYLGDDTGFPPAFEVLADLKAAANDVPLSCAVPFPDFCKAVKEHRLVGGVFYNVTDVPDPDSANKCMALLRNYRSC
jgi:hypothetical protein